MLSFSQLGKKGNLGNQLFQIASTIGLARKHGHSWCFPDWKYCMYFETSLEKCSNKSHFKRLEEKFYHHQAWPINDNNYDLDGWLQTEKYFDIEFTKDFFSFKPAIKSQLLKNHHKIFKKETILISVRRGDFVHHPLYFQLSYKYYFLALTHNFSKWKNYNLVFTSDDIQWCKKHFGRFKNAYFLEGLDPMQQIIVSAECDHFIISNSTFSWWQAWLGEKQNSKIIRPAKNHRDTEYVQVNDKDYFPDRWIKFDHRNKSIPLKYIFYIFSGEKHRFNSFTRNKWNGIKHRLKVISK